MDNFTSLEKETYGLTDSHIVRDAHEAPVHRGLIQPIFDLKQSAQKAGYNLKIASGFRSFQRQSDIWNQKAAGNRPILDKKGKLLDVSTADPNNIAQAILRWSALPGASRHHWGSEIDVYDEHTLSPDYQLQLSSEEFASNGIFGDFNHWLSAHLETESCDFYRPYATDRGGVSPEPWHLSFKPIAATYAERHNLARLEELILRTDIELKAYVIENLSTLYSKYVSNVDE